MGDLAETHVPSQPRHVSRASLPTTPLPPRPCFRVPSLHLSLLYSPSWSMWEPSMSSMIEAYTCSACTVARMPTWPCNKRMSSSPLVLGSTIAQRGKWIVSNSSPHSSTIRTDVLPVFTPAACAAAQQGRGGIIHFEIMPKNVNKVVDASIPVVGDMVANLASLVPLIRSSPSTEWFSDIKSWKEKYPFTYAPSTNGGLMKPQEIIQEFDKQT